MTIGNRNWACRKDAWRVRVVSHEGKIEFEDHPPDEAAARAMAERLRVRHFLTGKTVALQHRALSRNRYKTVDP